MENRRHVKISSGGSSLLMRLNNVVDGVGATKYSNGQGRGGADPIN